MHRILCLHRGLILIWSIALLSLSSCVVGPDYRRPEFDASPHYKELEDWKPSEPEDALSRGPWWHIFDDAVLDELEQQIAISNQNIRAPRTPIDRRRGWYNRPARILAVSHRQRVP